MLAKTSESGVTGGAQNIDELSRGIESSQTLIRLDEMTVTTRSIVEAHLTSASLQPMRCSVIFWGIREKRRRCDALGRGGNEAALLEN